MSSYSYFRPFIDISRFRSFSEEKQKKIIKQRQYQIIEYARKNSKYYNSIIPDDWKDITDIPTLDKETLLEKFNDIVTDDRITLNMVLNKMKKVPADGTLLNDYIITRTSGSSRKPTIVVHDKNSANYATMVGFIRGIKFNVPIATITTLSDFSVEAEITRHNLNASAFMQKYIFNIDSSEKPEKMAKILLERQPKSIVGYSSVIRILATTLIEEKKTLQCQRVYLSGESYTDIDKKKMQKAFPNAKITGIYGCTEGGVLGYECEYGHMHINSDLVLIEAVDENDKPVPYGVKSDQTLLTCYFNRVQPLIRYKLGDRITLHQGCRCGVKDDWLEIEGRTNDILPFEVDGKTILVSPMDLLCIMGEISEDGLSKFREFQIVFHKPNTLEIRLDCFNPEDRKIVFDEVKNTILVFLENRGGGKTAIYLSDLLPEKTTTNGKQKRIIAE